MPSSSSSPRDSLRQDLRRKRRTLTVAEREAANRAIANHLSAYTPFRRARRIAAYYPVASEVDTTEVMLLALAQGKQLHLPVIGRPFRKRLQFSRVEADSYLTVNRHGIPQPQPRTADRSLRRLDVVLVPLLGFDSQGNRLGSGAGYYDHSFDFRRRRGGRPLLVGLAFECQRTKKLTPEKWDVPLDVVVTEKGVAEWRR